MAGLLGQGAVEGAHPRIGRLVQAVSELDKEAGIAKIADDRRLIGSSSEGTDGDRLGREGFAQGAGEADGAGIVAMDADRLDGEPDRRAIAGRHLARAQEAEQARHGGGFVMDQVAGVPRGTRRPSAV